MKLIETKNGAIDVSPDVLLQYAASISKGFPVKAFESQEIAEDFLKFDLEDLLRIGERRGLTHLKSIRALVAHGKSDHAGNFWYVDRTATDEPTPLIPVQSWIDVHDGKYDLLVVYPCPTAGALLSSKFSFLAYAKQGLFNSEDIKRAWYDIRRNLLFQPPNLFAANPLR